VKTRCWALATRSRLQRDRFASTRCRSMKRANRHSPQAGRRSPVIIRSIRNSESIVWNAEAGLGFGLVERDLRARCKNDCSLRRRPLPFPSTRPEVAFHHQRRRVTLRCVMSANRLVLVIPAWSIHISPHPWIQIPLLRERQPASALDSGLSLVPFSASRWAVIPSILANYLHPGQPGSASRGLESRADGHAFSLFATIFVFGLLCTGAGLS